MPKRFGKLKKKILINPENKKSMLLVPQRPSDTKIRKIIKTFIENLGIVDKPKTKPESPRYAWRWAVWRPVGRFRT